MLGKQQNADFWDKRMGDNSNSFHREIVRPHTELLLDIHPNDFILDIACGNGNFPKRLAEQGAKVVAFDNSSKLIENAKKRQPEYLDLIDFNTCDATNYEQILSLRKEKLFDKAVSNMAVMDISNIVPLFQAVYELLRDDGVFVFSTHHPCFERPTDKYITSYAHKGEAIIGQPVLQEYYHRPLQEILNCCFSSGFVMDGFFEEVDGEVETPIIIIVRLRKPLHTK